MSRYLLLFLLMAIATLDGRQQAPARLESKVIDWNSLKPAPTRTGERREVFDAPTATLDKLHGHITTLNPGENTGPLHRHPQEELVIIKEGTIEVNIEPQAGGGSRLGRVLRGQREREHDQRRQDAGDLPRAAVVHAPDAEDLIAFSRRSHGRGTPTGRACRG